MANDTFAQVWNRVLLRCPAATSFLAKDWVNNAFRQIAERRRWSWKLKFGQFLVPAVYRTGTASVEHGSTTVTGTGTAWTTGMVGRQFRLFTGSPIYTINQVTSPTLLELDAAYGGDDYTDRNYQIYQCYFTPPEDFHSFLTVWDSRLNWQLWLHIQQREINLWDAQRANIGQVYVVASFDYTTSRVGIVSAVTQVLGSGSSPVATGSYAAPQNALFTIECTFAGTSGSAQYRWKKNTGAYTANVLTDPEAQDLQDGVQIYWPTATYTLGDVWVIQATATQSAGLPRYELWPHQQAQYVYPFLYESRPADLTDPNAVLPRYIRGDVLLEMALASAARWPGPSADKKNPYFDPRLANMHELRAERMIMELEKQDDEVMEMDLTYQQALGYPLATPLGDSSWLQNHAI